MSFGDWFRVYWLTNPFLWWISFIVLWVVAQPFLRILRLWLAHRRFMAQQGRALENPQNAEVRFLLAQVYADGRRWRRAEEQVRDALRVAKESPLYDGLVPYRFQCLLGRIRLARGDARGAVELFREALTLKADRGYAEAHYGLGRALHRSGDPRAALEQYRAVEDELASNFEFYFRRAQAAADAGDAAELARAREGFRTAARLLPAFAGRRRLRWRLAFLLFPLTRYFI